jgi:antitoxin ParD1/3/4
MTITLTPELETLVHEKVARGEYDSADALVSEAVLRLIAEQEEEDAHRDEIRTRIDAAEAEIDRGEYLEYDEHTIYKLGKDIHERGLQRLAKEGEKTGPHE